MFCWVLWSGLELFVLLILGFDGLVACWYSDGTSNQNDAFPGHTYTKCGLYLASFCPSFQSAQVNAMLKHWLSCSILYHVNRKSAFCDCFLYTCFWLDWWVWKLVVLTQIRLQVHVVCKEFGNSASSAQADSGAHAKLPYAVPLENSRYCEIHEVYKISAEDSVLYFLLQLGMLFKPDSSTIYTRSSFVWLGNFMVQKPQRQCGVPLPLLLKSLWKNWRYAPAHLLVTPSIPCKIIFCLLC